MANATLNEETQFGNMKQADAILEKTCGKLAIITGAMKNGSLSEEAQSGLLSLIQGIKSDIERAGAIIQAIQRE